MTPQVRRVLPLVAVLGATVVALVLLVNSRQDLSLEERAEILHEIDPYGLEELKLDKWIQDGTVLRAMYQGRGSPASFELRLWPSSGRAKDWFHREAGELSERELVQEGNTFDGVELCARVNAETRCIGWDATRSFVGTSVGAGTDIELNALLLMRTARKHWYRAFD